MVFSRNGRAFQSLKQQFFDRSAGREYLLIVDGKPNPPKGKRESYLIQWQDGSVHETHRKAVADHAITHYQTLEGKGRFNKVKCNLETGRKHQLRVHLAAMNCPIVGDRMYHPQPVDTRLMLVAIRLKLLHPRTGEPIEFSLDTPPEMQQWWESLPDVKLSAKESIPPTKPPIHKNQPFKSKRRPKPRGK